jgi:hypothetical protein
MSRNMRVDYEGLVKIAVRISDVRDSTQREVTRHTSTPPDKDAGAADFARLLVP